MHGARLRLRERRDAHTLPRYARLVVSACPYKRICHRVACCSSLAKYYCSAVENADHVVMVRDHCMTADTPRRDHRTLLARQRGLLKLSSPSAFPFALRRDGM